MSAPLILTAALDAAAFAHFDELRRRHFPPERNFLRAHLTLFHALPGEEEARVAADVAEAAAARGPVTMTCARVLRLGRGTAFGLDAPDLAALRGELAARWRPLLTRQDAQWSRPHVTVQNKVAPEAAAALATALAASFTPFPVTAEGLELWRYRGGPWEAAGSFPFGRPSA